MIIMYSLKKIAEREETTENNLRVMLHRLLKKGKPLEWRNWKFHNFAGKVWIAVGIDQEFEFEFID